MKQRIWELDVFRGICILGMLAVHFIFDAVELFGIISWDYPPAFVYLQQWGGTLFLLLSGICVTLGSKHIRRGLIVLSCGLLCTAVTVAYARLANSGEGMIIWFGVLHCLGLCMLLWQLFRKMPVPVLAVLGILMAVLGIYLNNFCFSQDPYWIILGIPQVGFVSPDYFPLLPNLGFFLLGAVLGRILYKNKRSLFPKVSENNPVIAFLSACGRYSLFIYLLHQPVLMAILSLFA